MNKDNINQKSFELYENVRRSGVTNMFNIKKVMKLSTLLREEVICIIENYEYLANKYLL